MTLKTKFSIFAFIMFLSLVSMGFASWTISTPNEEPTLVSYTITAEDSVNSSDYFELLNTESFTYFTNGFTNNNGEIIDNGSITLKFNISDECLKFDFELKFNESLNIELDLNVFDSIKYQVKNSDEEVLQEGNTTKFSFDLSEIEGSIIYIIYTFTKNSEDFNSSVYLPILKENTDIFSYKITVNEIKQVDK